MEGGEEEAESDALVFGWGFVVAATLAAGLWSSRFLIVPGDEAPTTLVSFWPLALGILFVFVAFRIGLSVIAKQRFYSGLTLVLMSILLPLFGALWPFALKVLQLVSSQ